MRLYGRLTGCRGPMLEFAGDLKANLDNADAVAEGIKDAIDDHIATNDIDARIEPGYVPV